MEEYDHIVKLKALEKKKNRPNFLLKETSGKFYLYIEFNKKKNLKKKNKKKINNKENSVNHYKELLELFPAFNSTVIIL